MPTLPFLPRRASAAQQAATPGPGRWLAAVLAGVALSLASCSQDANPLAPYEGNRPLDILRVTQSFTPEMQWVGGRVAAVGVNRGTRAALDSSLVWIRVAPGDDIGSYVRVGEAGDRARVEQYGGVPLDSLEDGATYTFWLAEQAALEAGLDSTQIDPAAFADTTVTMQLVLRGQSGGSALGVTFEIVRDERLVGGERLVMRWTPEDVRFRRVAIRQAVVGGFTDLIWHALVPDGQAPSIGPPLTIGVTPEGADEVVAFPASGFEPETYLFWAVTDDWNESFLPNAPGYAFFRLLACNFDPENPCPPSN